MTTKLVITEAEQALDALSILRKGQQRERRSLVNDIIKSKNERIISGLLAAVFAERSGVYLERKPKLTKAQIDSALETLLGHADYSTLTWTFEWLAPMRLRHDTCLLFAQKVMEKGGVVGAFHIVRDLPVRRFRKIRLEAVKRILRCKSPSDWSHGWYGGTTLSPEEASLLVKKVGRYARWGWAEAVLESNERTFQYGTDGRKVRRHLLPEKHVSAMITLVAKERRVWDLERFFERLSTYLSRELTATEGKMLAERMVQLSLAVAKRREYNWESHVAVVTGSPHCAKYLGPETLGNFKKKIEVISAEKKVAIGQKTST